MTGRELHWKSGGREIVVNIIESGSNGTLRVDDQTIPFAVHDRDVTGGWIQIDGRNQRFYVYRNRDAVAVWIDGRTYHLSRVQKRQSVDQAAGDGSGEARALMPGKILRIPVTTGETVTEKQPLVIMESMKMETTLVAARAGTVTAVKCKVGQIVEMGELLVVIE